MPKEPQVSIRIEKVNGKARISVKAALPKLKLRKSEIEEYIETAGGFVQIKLKHSDKYINIHKECLKLI